MNEFRKLCKSKKNKNSLYNDTIECKIIDILTQASITNPQN